MEAEGMGEVLVRLNMIEEKLNLLVQQRPIKDWYTTSEVAQILGKAEFTVREWCRLGRAARSEGGARADTQPGRVHDPRSALTRTDA
jgi:hypothetical protein